MSGRTIDAKAIVEHAVDKWADRVVVAAIAWELRERGCGETIMEPWQRAAFERACMGLDVSERGQEWLLQQLAAVML